MIFSIYSYGTTKFCLWLNVARMEEYKFWENFLWEIIRNKTLRQITRTNKYGVTKLRTVGVFHCCFFNYLIKLNWTKNNTLYIHMNYINHFYVFLLNIKRMKILILAVVICVHKVTIKLYFHLGISNLIAQNECK